MVYNKTNSTFAVLHFAATSSSIVKIEQEICTSASLSFKSVKFVVLKFDFYGGLPALIFDTAKIQQPEPKFQVFRLNF
jgi:hypothetical protein